MLPYIVSMPPGPACLYTIYYNKKKIVFLLVCVAIIVYTTIILECSR